MRKRVRGSYEQLTEYLVEEKEHLPKHQPHFSSFLSGLPAERPISLDSLPSWWTLKDYSPKQLSSREFPCISLHSNRIWSFFWECISTNDALQKGALLRCLLHADISPPSLPSCCYCYYYRFHNNMTWRVTICLGDTNSKNDVFFLSMCPLPAVGCWHD